MSDITEFGRALFLLSEEEGNTETVIEDMRVFNAALLANPDYAKLTDTPALAKEERLALLDRALAGLSECVRNLVKILAERRLVYAFSKVAECYFALYDESRGIERVEAITARALTEEQTARLKAKLTRLTGKTVVIGNTVDPTILGGMKLRYSGTQLDGSVKTRLDTIEESLSGGVVS